MKFVSLCLLAAALMLTAHSGFAQSSLTFGRDGRDVEGYEVIATSDGGYMVGGHCTDANGKNQYWVAKIDRTGKVAWDSLYTFGFKIAFLWSIQPSDDGGALLAGYTGVQGSGEESALLVKIDAVGRVVKTLDVNYNRADHGHWFAHRKQGGYFWGGHTDSEGDPTGEMILQKLDTGMTTVWDSTYALAENSGEHAHTGTLTSDGGCILTGHTEVNGQEHTWAVRVDSNGVPMWMKLFDSSANESTSPYRIQPTREGGFAIFGFASSSTNAWLRLLVIDSAGNVLIDKRYGSGDYGAFSGIQCSDGGYMIAGYVATNTTEKAVVVRADAKGKQLWLKEYDGLGLAWAYDVFERKSQFVVIGGTSPTATTASQLWVLYIDSNGTKVDYDTSRPMLVFALDSTQLHYRDGRMDSMSGWLQNPSADSVHFDFSVAIDAARLGTFFSYTTFGNSKEFFGSSQKPIGIGPHETLPIKIHISPYEPKRGDTASICYTVTPLTEAAVSPDELCVTLLPEVTTGAVAGMPSEAPRLQIFPNPVRSGSNAVQFLSTLPIEHIEIKDILGKHIQTLTPTSIGEHSIVWDGRDAANTLTPPGEYFIRAVTNDGILLAKLIVQN